MDSNNQKLVFHEVRPSIRENYRIRIVLFVRYCLRRLSEYNRHWIHVLTEHLKPGTGQAQQQIFDSEIACNQTIISLSWEATKSKYLLILWRAGQLHRFCSGSGHLMPGNYIVH